jgi:hypothetical protein
MQKLDRLFISILQHQSVVTENLPIQMYLKILAAHSILNLDPFLMQKLRARSPRHPCITSPRARFANGPATPGCPRTRTHSPLAPRSAPIHARARAAAGGARAGAALGITIS